MSNLQERALHTVAFIAGFALVYVGGWWGVFGGFVILICTLWALEIPEDMS